MTDPGVGRARRRRRIRTVSLAVALAIALTTGVAVAASSRTPSARPGRAAGSPPTTSPTLSEADRIRQLDRVQVDRSAAAADASAGPSSTGAASANGVWRLGALGTYVVGKGIPPGTYESA